MSKITNISRYLRPITEIAATTVMYSTFLSFTLITLVSLGYSQKYNIKIVHFVEIDNTMLIFGILILMSTFSVALFVALPVYAANLMQKKTGILFYALTTKIDPVSMLLLRFQKQARPKTKTIRLIANLIIWMFIPQACGLLLALFTEFKFYESFSPILLFSLFESLYYSKVIKKLETIDQVPIVIKAILFRNLHGFFVFAAVLFINKFFINLFEIENSFIFIIIIFYSQILIAMFSSIQNRSSESFYIFLIMVFLIVFFSIINSKQSGDHFFSVLGVGAYSTDLAIDKNYLNSMGIQPIQLKTKKDYQSEMGFIAVNVFVFLKKKRSFLIKMEIDGQKTTLEIPKTHFLELPRFNKSTDLTSR